MSNFNEGDVFDNRYKLQTYLGGGELSEVWKVFDELAGITVVIKIYVRAGEAGIKQFIKDFTLTESLNHPNILRPSHVAVCDRRPYLILKFYSRGSVANRIENTHEQYSSFSETDIARFMQQIGGALKYLHEHEILHRDIKPDNILLGDNGEFVLTDFGISKKAKNSLSKATSSTQVISFSRPYAPPEVLTNNDDPKKDIFSLGVTMFELLTEDLPFEGNGGTALLMGGTVPSLPAKYAPALNTLLKKCMHKNAADRPTAAEIEEWGTLFLKTGKWKENESQIITKTSKTIGDTAKKLSDNIQLLKTGQRLQDISTASANKVKEGIKSASVPLGKIPKQYLIYGIIGVAVLTTVISVVMIWPSKSDTTESPKAKPASRVVSKRDPVDSLLLLASQKLAENDCATANALLTKIKTMDTKGNPSVEKLYGQSVRCMQEEEDKQNAIINEQPETASTKQDQDFLKAMAVGKKHYLSKNWADAYLAYKKACAIKSEYSCQTGIKVCRSFLEKEFKDLIAHGENNDKNNPAEAMTVFKKAAELATRTQLFESQVNEEYNFYLKEGNRYLDKDNNQVKAKKLFEFAQIFKNDQRVRDLINSCQ